MNFDNLMMEIVTDKITDIHIDPIKRTIIFRRHKRKVKTLNTNVKELYEYLKFKSNISLESFSNLQTGSFTYTVFDKRYYLRFAILENYARSHGVLRVLNIKPIDNLSQCGIDKQQVHMIQSILNKSHGLVLFCGKTGAGKSTTMFAGLNEIKDKEIFTLENPIEKYFEHMIQLECTDESLHLHISQLLRHDPDILVIGEIRNSIELQQAIRAALSGHLIVSTLHAGDASEVILRLRDLQISEFELEAVLEGIIFQSIVGLDDFKFEVYDRTRLCHILKK